MAKVENLDAKLKRKQDGMVLTLQCLPFAFPSEKKFTEDHVTSFVLKQGRIHAALVNGKNLLKAQLLRLKTKWLLWVITSFRSP